MWNFKYLNSNFQISKNSRYFWKFKIKKKKIISIFFFRFCFFEKFFFWLFGLAGDLRLPPGASTAYGHHQAQKTKKTLSEKQQNRKKKIEIFFLFFGFWIFKSNGCFLKFENLNSNIWNFTYLVTVIFFCWYSLSDRGPGQWKHQYLCVIRSGSAIFRYFLRQKVTVIFEILNFQIFKFWPYGHKHPQSHSLWVWWLNWHKNRSYVSKIYQKSMFFLFFHQV